MDIDETAKALGVELMPWQREIGQRILDGEQIVISLPLRSPQHGGSMNSPGDRRTILPPFKGGGSRT